MKRHLRTVIVTGLAAGALALAACGGSDEQKADGSSSGEVSAELKESAKKTVADLAAAPTVRDLEPLSKTPSPGKTVVFVTCPIPSCTQSTGEVKKATDLLGWTLKEIRNEFTPESYASAFDTALQLNPDYIYYIASMPESTITAQLAEAKKRGIPVIVNSPGPDSTIGGDSPLVGATSYTRDVGVRIGELMAQVVFSDATSLDHVTMLYDPTSDAYKILTETFISEIEKAGGTVDRFEINQGDSANALPGQVVSYLQRNPDTEYLIGAQDDMLIGVPEAIAGSGQKMPKIVGQTPGAQTPKYLADGSQLACVVPDGYGGHWDAIDMMARLSVGDEITDDQPAGNFMIATKSNLADVPERTFIGVPDDYAAAWGVS